MGRVKVNFISILLALLALSKCNGVRFPLPSQPTNEGGTNFKLRLPNELEMGFAQSPEKIETNEVEEDVNANNSKKKYQHRNIHMDMNTPQLQFHFGVSNPREVDKDSYQVIKIVPIVVPSSMWNNRKEHHSAKDKRDESETSPHFEINAFDRKIRIPMKKENTLLKRGFKVVHIDKDGNRNEMRTKRMVQNHSRVGLNSGMKLTKTANSSRMSVVEEDELENPIDEEYEQAGFQPSFQELCSEYRHASTRYVSALTECEDDGTRGFITDTTAGNTLEVHPLGSEFAHLFEDWDCEHCRKSNISNPDASKRARHGYHLVVKRSLEDAQKIFETDNKGKKRSVVSRILERSSMSPIKTKQKRSGSVARKIVELGIFIDDKAYQTYDEYFNPQPCRDEKCKKETKRKIIFLILALMNGVQAVYHYPTLPEPVDFRIVYLELQESRKINHGGEQGDAYESFCGYQLDVMEDLNALEDSHPQHWDTSLLVSGWNFYGKTADGRRSYATMGLAAVEGMCYQSRHCGSSGRCNGPYNCVIGEMGVKDFQGKPYPSCGFTAVFVMAHEIGHNLGMSHDGKRTGNTGRNSCPTQGFIMSPSRGTKGETLWSRCSATIIRELDMPCLEEGQDTQSNAPGLDHNMFGNLPGLIYTPSKQCQIYTQDKNARLYIKSTGRLDEPNQEICTGLKCKVTDGNSGYYTAGPALEGTVCGTNHYCIKSRCVPLDEYDIKQIMSAARQNQNNVEPLPPPPHEEVGLTQATWSEWDPWSNCESKCILGSKGSRRRYRKCNIPRHLKDLKTSNCPGSVVQVDICDHECRAVKPATSFAQTECQKYRSSKRRLYHELTGDGKQPSHNPKYPEQSCTVYCQLHEKSSKEYYSPHVEISGMKDIQIHFPDGTRCHQDKHRNINYYCKKGNCGQEGSRLSRAESGTPEVPFEQSANPSDGIGDPNEEGGIGESLPPDNILRYFTLNKDDQKLGESLEGGTQEDKEFVVDEEILVNNISPSS